MKRTAPGVILAYHRIGQLARDPFSMAVPQERFAAQLGALREAVHAVPLAEIGAHDRPTFAVTLDDGYADAVDAEPILAELGIPATLFVTSDVLTASEEFWWDRLEHLLLDGESVTPALRIEVRGRPLHVDVRTAAGRARALRALNHRLRTLPKDEIDTLLSAVGEQVGRTATPCAEHRHIDQAQLGGLVARDVIDIGGHTRTHTMLTALHANEQRDEIEGSRRALEAATATSVRSFAYPFGNPGSFDAAVAAVARGAGYERACINISGNVTRKTNRFLLPRLPVYDWSPDQLVHEVQRALEH